MPASNNTKAFLETEDGQRISCMFNPADLALSQSNAWVGSTTPGKGAPVLRYTGAASGVLRLTLFFDTTADGQSVSTHTSQIAALMDVNTSLPGSSSTTNNARPPWVIFHWGDFHSFKSVVTQLDVTYDYFGSDGTPLRARANMTLTQYQPDSAKPAQNPTSGTPYPHRVHRVQPGETLDRISALHFGDSTRWRDIAAANGIEDPLALQPGALLAIPGRF